jgi:hypothetical protein
MNTLAAVLRQVMMRRMEFSCGNCGYFDRKISKYFFAKYFVVFFKQSLSDS